MRGVGGKVGSAQGKQGKQEARGFHGGTLEKRRLKEKLLLLRRAGPQVAGHGERTSPAYEPIDCVLWCGILQTRAAQSVLRQ